VHIAATTVCGAIESGGVASDVPGVLFYTLSRIAAVSDSQGAGCKVRERLKERQIGRKERAPSQVPKERRDGVPSCSRRIAK
jgi:hypothetical protein